LGIKDDSRLIEGNICSNRSHVAFFNLLLKKLKVTKPASNHLLDIKSYSVVFSDDEKLFYPIIDRKLFIITIKRPESDKIFASSKGMFYERIEEGVWPISSY